MQRCLDEDAHIREAAEVVVRLTEFHCQSPVAFAVAPDGVVFLCDDHLAGYAVAIADEETENIRDQAMRSPTKEEEKLFLVGTPKVCCCRYDKMPATVFQRSAWFPSTWLFHYVSLMAAASRSNSCRMVSIPTRS